MDVQPTTLKPVAALTSSLSPRWWVVMAPGLIAFILLMSFFLMGERFFYAMVFLLPGIINLGIIGIFFKQRSNASAISWFVLFLSALTVWSITDFFSTLAASAAGYEFWAAASAVGYVFIPATFFAFVQAFIGREAVSRISYGLMAVLFAPAFAFLFIILTTDLVVVTDFSRAQLKPWGHDAPTAPFFWVFLAWFEAVFITALLRLIAFYRRVRGVAKKQQLRLLIIGLLIPLVGGTVTDGILPLFDIQFFPTAVPLTAVLGLFVAYAITRYGLLAISPVSIAANVLRSTAAVIIAADEHDTIQFFNQAAPALLGLPSSALTGQPLATIISASLIQSVKTELSQSTATRQLVRREIEIAPQPSVKIPVAVTASVLRDEAGHTQGITWVVSDRRAQVATTRALEQKVQETETAKQLAEDTRRAILNVVEDLATEKERVVREKARTEALLQSIGDGIIATDARGKTVFINPAAEELFGLSIGTSRGKPLTSLLTFVDANGQALPDNEQPTSQALRQKRRIQSSLASSYLVKKNDGTILPVTITVTPVIGEGKPLGGISVYRDVTKESEIDKAKTEFVSLASHQLRTPLSTINWYAEMLLAGDVGTLTKDQRQYLDEIYRGNQRMVELVNAMLNVSRIELGSFIIEPKPTDVLALARSVIAELKFQISEKKLTLKTSFAKNLPTIPADQKLLRIVYQNLLSNAVKYTPSGGTITVTVTVDLAVDELIIKVQDTGYGIPKAQQDKIFTKLFRADNVREKSAEGTGLGLYLVKSIVDHVGGRVWFQSKENKGSTFYATLPLSGMKPKAGTKAIT